MHFRTLLMAGAAVAASAASLQAAELRGVVLDRASGEPLAARLYIVAADGTWYFARPAQPAGQAFEYRRARQPDSSENYTELSAHPFVAELPPGRYTVTAERGHEYLPDTQEVAVGNEPATVELRLTRWIEMAGHGWYSGDTHVHRPLEELPLAMLAEDLNVAFPITYWVHRAGDLPARDNLVGGRPPAPEAIRVDDTHLIWPINTEYEIFQVGGRQHTLGAVLIVGHRTPLELAVPPVAAIAPAAAAQARPEADSRRKGGAPARRDPGAARVPHRPVRRGAGLRALCNGQPPGPSGRHLLLAHPGRPGLLGRGLCPQ